MAIPALPAASSLAPTTMCGHAGIASRVRRHRRSGSSAMPELLARPSRFHGQTAKAGRSAIPVQARPQIQRLVGLMRVALHVER